MEYINCIICNRNDSEQFLTGRDFRYNTSEETFTIVKCKRCGLLYVNHRPTKDEIGQYYPDNYRTRETLKSAVQIENKIKKYYKTKRSRLFFKNPWYIDLPIGTTVLDIGCGAGELLLRLKELGCNAYGIDVDEITSKYLSKTMNLKVINCDIDNGTQFQADFFDVIIMQHSLEHVHNPLNVLTEVSRIIKPKGILIIGVPNIDSYISQVTRENWGDLDIPRHLFHFTPSTISALLNTVGFSIETIQHEFRISRPSLKRWMATIPSPLIFMPKPLTDLIGIAFSLLHKGERIVVKARKKLKSRF
jgi:2-polyprenyl-3-methyl-5-hydroxy-6-metoxy-1,4-benzoquinol methylase